MGWENEPRKLGFVACMNRRQVCTFWLPCVWCVCVCVGMSVHVWMCGDVYLDMCVCVCMCMCVCVCVYALLVCRRKYGECVHFAQVGSINECACD